MGAYSMITKIMLVVFIVSIAIHIASCTTVNITLTEPGDSDITVEITKEGGTILEWGRK